ncbi:MAG: SH3 domain-containing protein [Eubacteriales bacterium]|nr:SH3 domain-containing protein [Eubacteriales bacterium]
MKNAKNAAWQKAALIMALLAILFTLLPCALGENQHGLSDVEWQEWKKSNAEHPSYMLHFTDQWPDEMQIAPFVQAAGYAGVTLVEGYASRRFGDWQFAEAILKDELGYVLLCASYYKTSNEWGVAASKAALRQNEAPILQPEGVLYDYDDYDVGQSDGCSRFQVIYPDTTYDWMSGSKGFMLVGIGDMTVSPRTISRALSDGTVEYVFNVGSVFIEDFDIAPFPTSFEAARELANASVYADNAKAVTTLTEYVDSASSMPPLKLLEQPSENSAAIALVCAQVEADVVEIKDNFVRVRIGTLAGWLPRSNVLIGTERAAEWSWVGDYTQVYAYGRQKEQRVYGEPSTKSSQVAVVFIHQSIYLQAMTIGGDWDLVRLEDGTLGWMPFDAVSQTSNFYNAWAYSEDPTRRLNLRKGPGKEYESIGKYYSGVQVVNLYASQYQEGWSHVIIEGVSGWVDSSFLKSWSDYAGLSWLPPLRKISTSGAECPVYRQPTAASDLLVTSKPNGTPAEIIGVIDSWAHVRFRDGVSGYVELQFLGGEPKAADSNSFTLSGDVTPTSYDGQYTYGTLCAGTKVKIIERPASEWRVKSTEEDTSTWEWVFEENPRVFVRALGAEDGTGGYLSQEKLALWNAAN